MLRTGGHSQVTLKFLKAQEKIKETLPEMTVTQLVSMVNSMNIFTIDFWYAIMTVMVKYSRFIKIMRGPIILIKLEYFLHFF